ncbi:hypothetical protein B0J11DRAFT_522002 [Dendryphion nanum]|uniref:Glutamate--tRNA ligase, mitochondrial n=1 Tax=Dendryphion nanum TaxID=256645 RepID=A0A9P9E517_9PLEO|nr:hypothetical protein B0J11DRAFT_522002 [Dendryphion nanum]
MSFPLLPRPQLASIACRSCILRLTSIPKRSASKAVTKAEKRAFLPSSPVRTRFAPSPTGYLHLGSLRTALFNYLIAKRTGGQFLLRIEDTDQKRTIPDAEERLFRDLRWAGLEWDEGPEIGGPYGPYKQSERTEHYKEHADILINSGHAYRCFCTPARLHSLAEHRHQLGLATDYDRSCAYISREESADRASRGEKHTVRLLASDPYPTYKDVIYGTFKPVKQHRRGEDSYEDPILLKSDGLPTYHLANVVDDHLMKITHVIRGSEWMPSTPKHIDLYNAFNWTPPNFAHVGLLVDENGNKLSKRNFDTDISAFKEMEIFPETLTNFTALLGWSHQEKSDVMDLKTLVDKFTLKFTKGNTTVTFGKMHFLQRKHATTRAKQGGTAIQPMVQNVMRLLESPESPFKGWEKRIGIFPEKFIEEMIQADAENYTNANEFVYRNSFLFQDLRHPKSFTDGEDIPTRAKSLAEVREWTKENLMQKVREIIDGRSEGKEGAKDVYHYLRKALTDREDGMRIYDVMTILGREETLARLGVVGEEES